jgi:hypothetical protein
LAGFSSVALAQTAPGAALGVTNATLPTTETTGAVWSANYSLVTGERQFGSGMLDASNTNVLMGSSLTGGGAVPVAVSNNTLQSLAFGNQTSSGSGLSLLTGSLLSMNLQSLSGLIQPGVDLEPATIGSLSVSAVVDSSSAFITQSGMDSADLALTGNTLEAGTQLNVADIRVVGVTPAGYVSTATGSSAVTFGATGASMGTVPDPDAAPAVPFVAGTTGSVNLSNLQSTFSASPSATVSDSSVALTVSDTTPVVVGGASVFSSAASVNDNTLSASTGINTGTSIFQAEAGSAAWNGSVSVTNLQNAAAIDGTTDSLASVSGSAVTADLRFGTGGQTNLTGSLTLNDNQISANSTGNSAGARTTSGAVSAGNAITFEGGADITGSGSGTGTSVALASGTAQSVADLTLVNAQANAASSFTTSVTGGDVISNTDNLAGGTVTQSGNAITASSTANLAGNLVSAGQGGSVANFTASVAALNVQSNKSLDSTASVEDSAVSAVVGIAGAVPTGTVTLSGNTLAATAEGNVGVTTVALKAANLTATAANLGPSSTQGVTLNPAAGTASSSLGVVALSVQSNEGGSLTANNEGTSVSLSFNDQDLVESANVNISAMGATLSGNRLQSTATANSASNSATLEGTNGTGLSAAVGNSQLNVDMAVSANAGSSTTPLAVSLTAGVVASSKLALTSNTLSSAATGNTAFSRLDVSLDNASGSALLTATPKSEISEVNGVTALADLALANSQINDNTDVTAAMVGGVSLDLGNVTSEASPSTIALSTNQIGATVEVNRASNAMALDVGNLSGMTAALASGQAISDSAATVTTAGAVTLAAGGVVGAALTASGNTVKSSAQGNAANNALSLTGTTATGAGTVLTAASAAASATAASTVADVSVANLQSSTGDVLSALTGDGADAAVTMNLGAVTGASTLSLIDNTISATTSVNSASNALRLDITTVTGMSAGVASAQTLSDSPANAITNGLVSVDALSLNGSSATVSGNAIAASVFGNSADNTLSLNAATASGRNVAPSAIVGASSTAAGDFAVANNQQVAGTAASVALSSITDGTVKISTNDGAGALGTSALTLSGNSVAAYSGANSATNRVALNVGQLSAASASVASRQVIESADVTSLTTGSVLLEGGAVTGSALALSENMVKSTSLGNVATNQVSLAGTNATGLGGTVASAASASAGTAANVVADIAVANLQNSNDITLSATTTGDVGLALGVVSAGSALTLTKNTIGALAQSNSATNTLATGYELAADNTLALASTNLSGMSAGVASSQATVGTVDATAQAPLTGAFSIDADSAANTPVVLSNNAFSAVAGMNEAFNTLTAAGASLLGRGGLADSSVGDASTTGVDFSVVNAQSGVGSVSALADPGTIGFTGSLTGGSLSIMGNTVLARASVNTASNQLSLAATSSLEATAVVNNVQAMDSVVSAIVGVGRLGADADLTVGGASTVAVSDNRVTAQATGNLASNALNATAVSGISSSGSTALPTFAVLNQQRTQGSIEAVLNGTNLGAALNGTGGSTSVQGNQMVALAYGNSVDNAIVMSALPGSLNTASAAITNVQYNMASITASVSGASMVASGTVNSSGSVNVSGNTITAQVVGNRSVNSITAAR